MELSAADRLEIHELMARYANTIDDRDWARFATVFSDDCRYELAGFGRLDVVLHGNVAVIDYMIHSAAHPVAHHATCVEVMVDGDVVRVRSKMIGELPGNQAGSADYHDVVTSTPHGWRIADRLVRLRRPERGDNRR